MVTRKYNVHEGEGGGLGSLRKSSPQAPVATEDVGAIIIKKNLVTNNFIDEILFELSFFRFRLRYAGLFLKEI